MLNVKTQVQPVVQQAPVPVQQVLQAPVKGPQVQLPVQVPQIPLPVPVPMQPMLMQQQYPLVIPPMAPMAMAPGVATYGHPTACYYPGQYNVGQPLVHPPLQPYAPPPNPGVCL